VFRIDARKQAIQQTYEQVSIEPSMELPPGAHLGDLLTPNFISRHSRFAAEDEMFEASGFVIQSAEDFAAIPDENWDRFIRENTVFDSWVAMLQAAQFEWCIRHLESLRTHG